jgi:hypothetical protein
MAVLFSGDAVSDMKTRASSSWDNEIVLLALFKGGRGAGIEGAAAARHAVLLAVRDNRDRCSTAAEAGCLLPNCGLQNAMRGLIRKVM